MSKWYPRLLLAGLAACSVAMLGVSGSGSGAVPRSFSHDTGTTQQITGRAAALRAASQGALTGPHGRPWSRGALAGARRTGLVDDFTSTVALSATDAWTVGNICKRNCAGVAGAGANLIAHWNGSRWAGVAAPVTGRSFLGGVAAASPTDIWAVGWDPTGSLALHWNGTAWAVVPSPNPGPGAALAGVAAVSGSDAWAVGNYCTSSACSVLRNLILHWNGSTWIRVPSPSPGGSFGLSAVAATSSTNAWAVGSYCASACGKSAETDHTLILHWNGTAWTQVSSPNPSTFGPTLSAVTAISASDAWAVGTWCVSGCGTAGNVWHALLLHWNGSAWTQAPSPGANIPILFGASASSSSNAWAVGSDDTFRSAILHWNGTSWARVPSPSPSPSMTALFGAAANSPSDAWAVGDTGFPFGPLKTLILHWNGSAWTQVNSPNP
jgi:hypothetical protein